MEVSQRFDTPCRRKELKAGPKANPTGGARPNLMTAAGIMALQRRVGNHAVASMVGKKRYVRVPLSSRDVRRLCNQG
jgi:hypothetical protein